MKKKKKITEKRLLVCSRQKLKVRKDFSEGWYILQFALVIITYILKCYVKTDISSFVV